MALHFQVEIHKLSFGFHASTISYKYLSRLPCFPEWERYHLSSISQMRRWSGPWLDIELTSHIPAKVHLEIRLLPLSLFPYLSLSPPFPLCLPHPSFLPPLQLAVIESGRIASCPFILTAHPPLQLRLPTTGLCCNYITPQWYRGCLCQGDTM